jgi:hypothetical protein
MKAFISELTEKPMLVRNGKDLSDQFDYRYKGADNGSASAYFIKFRQSLFTAGVVMSKPGIGAEMPMSPGRPPLRLRLKIRIRSSRQLLRPKIGSAHLGTPYPTCAGFGRRKAFRCDGSCAKFAIGGPIAFHLVLETSDRPPRYEEKTLRYQRLTVCAQRGVRPERTAEPNRENLVHGLRPHFGSGHVTAHAAALSSLSAPRMTILSASSAKVPAAPWPRPRARASRRRAPPPWSGSLASTSDGSARRRHSATSSEIRRAADGAL